MISGMASSQLQKSQCVISFKILFIKYPADIYLFKADNRNTRESAKLVQS